MADHVGACAAALLPLAELIKAHVFAAERIHGDDTTVPVLAKVKTKTGRLWTYVRDDRPFGGADPPAAVYFYSPDRGGPHPEQHLADYAGILQADPYGGFNALYEAGRKPGPITEAACWAHARRKLFELADVASKARGKTKAVISPIAFAAVQKFDAVFAAERSINGLSPAERVAARSKDIATLVNELIEWMKTERTKHSPHHDVTKAMNYMLKRITAFTCFLEDGRICISNNAAERALRGIALGRKAWLFAGSDRGGERAAIMFTLIQTAKLNDVDPQAWLADVLAPTPDHKITDSRLLRAGERGARPHRSRRLIMAAPGHVFTISRAAEILGQDEQLLWDLAGSLEPEDGCLWIYGTGDQQTMAFTDRGLECLHELIADHKHNALPPRP